MAQGYVCICILVMAMLCRASLGSNEESRSDFYHDVCVYLLLQLQSTMCVCVTGLL